MLNSLKNLKSKFTETQPDNQFEKELQVLIKDNYKSYMRTLKENQLFVELLFLAIHILTRLAMIGVLCYAYFQIDGLSELRENKMIKRHYKMRVNGERKFDKDQY